MISFFVGLGIMAVICGEICGFGAAMERWLNGKWKLDGGIFAASFVMQALLFLLVACCWAIGEHVLR